MRTMSQEELIDERLEYSKPEYHGEDCAECAGTGEVPCDSCNGEDLDEKPCYECDSKGTQPCTNCNGTGWIVTKPMRRRTARICRIRI